MRLGQRHPDDVGAAQRHHLAPVALVDRVDRLQAEPGGEHPVERGRRATALDVAEHDRAGLLAGLRLELLGQPLADAAEADVAERVELLVVQHHLAVERLRALGDHDDRRVLVLEPLLDVRRRPARRRTRAPAAG